MQQAFMFFVAVRRTLKTLGEKQLIKPQLVITTLIAAQHTGVHGCMHTLL